MPIKVIFIHTLDLWCQQNKVNGRALKLCDKFSFYNTSWSRILNSSGGYSGGSSGLDDTALLGRRAAYNASNRTALKEFQWTRALCTTYSCAAGHKRMTDDNSAKHGDEKHYYLCFVTARSELRKVLLFCAVSLWFFVCV